MEQRPKRLNILPANPEQEQETGVVGLGRFPSWLHRKLPKGNLLWQTGRVLSKNRMPTVCEEAKCPNLLECWSAKTATFLALGKECTRACGFCDIKYSAKPAALSQDEPSRLADSVIELGLQHVVITMVARDDLPDGGAAQLAAIIGEVKRRCPKVTIEVLTSDFAGNFQAIDLILAARPEIYNYNIETVRELTPRVRHKATYERTLAVLRYVKEKGSSLFVKSGLMLGLGEMEEQVRATLRDLKEVGCDIVTMGQYLQPNGKKLLVKSFVPPAVFKEYEEYGHSLGIKYMYCGPLVRSSYNAGKFFAEARK